MLGSPDGRALHKEDARSTRRPFNHAQQTPADRRRLVSEPALDRPTEVHPAHPRQHVVPVFRAGVRSADLRPLGVYLVAAIEIELHAESLPTDTFSELEPESVRLAKTASRSTLGSMNEMAFELRYLIADAGGLGRCDIDVLNHRLRRTLRNRGEYIRPIELAARRLNSRT